MSLPTQPGADNAVTPDPPVPSPTPEGGGRGRILLVDDEPQVGRVLSKWLHKCGYQTTLALSPADADKLLASSSFELVISDVNMPGNFRLEWVERLLNSGSVPPVLLITGAPALETACRAANLPVAGYLLKPLDFSALDGVVHGILQQHRRHREFLGVADDIVRLLATGGNEDTFAESLDLISRLTLLADTFRAQPNRFGPDRASDDTWRAAIADTIVVIEKTKGSFRSKELGNLRQRLQQLVRS